MSKQKRALIIGAGGIGTACVREFLKKKYTVYSTYYKNLVAKTKLEEMCGTQKVFYADVREKNDLIKIAEAIKSEGNLDVCINAVSPPLKLKLFKDLTNEECAEDIDTIIGGAINTAHIFLPLLNQKGSLLFLLSSVLKNHPPRMASYTLAKSAVWGLIKTLAVELRGEIRIIGISPSYVETDLLSVFPEKFLRHIKETLPGGVFLKAKDVANRIVEVVERPQKHSSGENIFLDTTSQ